MQYTVFRSKEQDLLQGCLRGNRAAQKALYDQYSPKMYPICLRYMKHHEDAEDVLVAAFTKIFTRLSQYKGEGSFEGWMKTIIVREALINLRRRHKQLIESINDSKDGLQIAAEETDHLETMDLFNLIQLLPPGYRTVFNLYAIDGYSHQEIAAQLNISENTSKSQLSRARNYLQNLIRRQQAYPNITRDVSNK